MVVYFILFSPFIWLCCVHQLELALHLPSYRAQISRMGVQDDSIILRFAIRLVWKFQLPFSLSFYPLAFLADTTSVYLLPSREWWRNAVAKWSAKIWEHVCTSEPKALHPFHLSHSRHIAPGLSKCFPLACYLVEESSIRREAQSCVSSGLDDFPSPFHQRSKGRAKVYWMQMI
jgi:hypothetical protein